MFKILFAAKLFKQLYSFIYKPLPVLLVYLLNKIFDALISKFADLIVKTLIDCCKKLKKLFKKIYSRIIYFIASMSIVIGFFGCVTVNQNVIIHNNGNWYQGKGISPSNRSDLKNTNQLKAKVPIGPSGSLMFPKSK